MAEPILTFRPPTPSDRGILCAILTKSYQEIVDLNEHPWIPGETMWQDYDDAVFDNLGHAMETVFLTESDGDVVGFASYTVQAEAATIGRNSVLPERRRLGVGGSQVREIIRRCRTAGVQRLAVVTGTHRFFLPAQRMYEKAGFVETGRFDDGEGVGRVLARFELALD